MYYLNYFFIFSILGHLVETIMFKILDKNMKSGFLYGYWTPIYGIGVILIIFVANIIFKKLEVNKILEVILFFIIITLVLTLVEYIGGNLLEIVFKKEFWNYSDHKIHFGKYNALDVSLTWGVFACTFWYLIKPWMDKLVVKIPHSVTYFLIILMGVDLFFTTSIKSRR